MWQDDQSSFYRVGEKALDLLGLIRTNVCGPFGTMTRGSERYFITFTDDFK